MKSLDIATLVIIWGCLIFSWVMRFKGSRIRRRMAALIGEIECARRAKANGAMKQVAPSPCPNCGTMLIAPGGRRTGDSAEMLLTPDSCPLTPVCRPRPGTLALCVCCGALLRYDDDMIVQLASADDHQALDCESRTLVKRVREALRARMGRFN